MIFLWVVLYGCLFTVTEYLSDRFWLEYSISSIAICVFAICFCVYCEKQSRKEPESISVAKTNKIGISTLVFLPLLLLPIFNCIALKQQFNLFAYLLMFGVCVCEEIFFRKYLLEFLTKKLKTTGFVLTALIFSLFHVVNIVNNCDFLFIFIQIICTFVAALCYNGLAFKYQSLIPSFVLHLITNLTGFNVVLAVSNVFYYVGLAVVIVIYSIYGIYFVNSQRKGI